MSVFIDDRQFFDFIFLENIGSLFQIGRLRGDHQIVFGHHQVDEFVEIAFKTQVAVRHDTDQHPIVIDYRNTPDMKFFHHRQRIAYRRAAFDSHRIVNHTVLGTFYRVYLLGLRLDRHIFMDHTDTAFASNRNG